VLTDIDGAWWLVVEALKRSAMSRLGRGPPVTAMVSPTVNPLTPTVTTPTVRSVWVNIGYADAAFAFIIIIVYSPKMLVQKNS